ncbi:hypothetical protein EXIGLDRAFT_759085 [Exidia glandulosa HHB12029]|uniref:DUF7582 domain-containing protein n=1 Tax=Exidia glandulosa HHB12029 TaxID=1314781 RepID=A0A165Q7L7_EXIGL|nr:hypothetical protein EXIGLDRAFT_759085 [Exidia glandulosa HHB12029]
MHKLKNLVLPELTELDADDIKAGLSAINKYLGYLDDYPGTPIRIVVVGGTCAVLVLKTRKKTKDIDYFVVEPTLTHLGLVGDAARMSDRVGDTKRFPRAWINSDVFAIVNRGDLDVYEHSIAQNEILFQADRLIVYAADWRFQLVNKMSRAHELRVEGVYDKKDLPDAVAIMHRLLLYRKGDIVPKSELVTWYMAGKAMEDDAIDMLNETYHAIHNITPVDKDR